MTSAKKQLLLEKLKECAEHEPEAAHAAADEALLAYINDPEVTKAFRLLKKWYA